jgi:glutathione synthase/RimK-type ligase-like ATP-grasp enzyme
MPDGVSVLQPQAILPPVILGTARLAALAFRGWSLDQLLATIGPMPFAEAERAAWLLDRSLAMALTFNPQDAAMLQAEALAITRVFRLHGDAAGPRLLAVMAPGTLMINAPLDFLTESTDVQLILAFTTPDGMLPAMLPDHDVLIVAASESHPAALAALPAQLANSSRPVLNDPVHVGRLSRDWLANSFAGCPGLTVAPTVRVTRSALRRQGVDMLLPNGHFPVLLRPVQSHGGAGLAKIDSADDLAMALLMADGDSFYLTQFIDYRSDDGWFHKYRIAFVDGAPFLCHMAASKHWMVHYLNAGMAESEAKRAAEAQAMAEFDTGFAVRHREAICVLCETVGLEYFSIDCAVAPDGSLLVFEADVAAIIHSMDDPAIYPYKAPVMQRCYDAFAAMLQRRMQPA